MSRKRKTIFFFTFAFYFRFFSRVQNSKIDICHYLFLSSETTLPKSLSPEIKKRVHSKKFPTYSGSDFE